MRDYAISEFPDVRLRNQDVFEPAITAANLKPYRVDRDPSTLIPIEAIERGIRDSDICFAEISTDNANVWFELGFAIAQGKDIIMVCSERSKYPFDIQHRTIISYKNDSTSDFDKLEKQITKKTLAVLEMKSQRQNLAVQDLTKPKSGLKSHEVACLLAILVESSGISGPVYVGQIESAMERSGYNSTATKLALRKLTSQEFISMEEIVEFEEQYEIFRILELGWNWIEQNAGELNLNTPKSTAPNFDSGDIPF